MAFAYYTFGSNTRTMMAYRSAVRMGIEAKLVPNPPGDPDCSMAVRIPAEKQNLAEDTWAGAEIAWKVKVVG
ncbi:MAG: hypothetical protein A2Y64_05040 [Candidatus Coatesbacteria bacterium RBG_13_66_14]|uniref:Putative Se/S carrier protein-like domain-containing protein n=1 Tax=Candidatus Coatesbacteria bacterium RBG_13_66_14 TaxID=1817816 RepID=A0A1F5EYJ4_9BACT|nr:MAG: hypothetical protein A2Y64_05040 [Candidatus Coatesbacteria bacterium RBG_13_66_14]